MIRAHTSDIVKGWIFDVHHGISPDEQQRYCVQHEEWQQIRLSMKGIPTHEKLHILFNWYEGKKAVGRSGVLVTADEDNSVIRLMQVTNYLGALRRGGQLDSNNIIQKYI